ncbi:50S ribosomal protein L20 [Patescibacteria group bacterium]|nr:50S ribosomal protein L20 [Patescibacteria group bacterium]
MPRVKGGPRARQRHKKVLKLAKGYRGTRSTLYRRANEAVIRAGEHSFKGRKERKRQFRRLWIARLNGALDKYEIKYSKFINALKNSHIDLDRKTLSQLAIEDPNAFEKIVEKVKPSIK